MAANNVTRLLDARKIKYQAFQLPVEKISARHTALLLNISPHIVYKSIVVVREKPGKTILAVIPGDHEVDLKTLAAHLSEKKLRIPTQREAEQLTGLQAGGISPLALINKGFQIILDSSASNELEIHISGGQLGLNIRLPVKSLLQLTNARLLPISKLMPDPDLEE